LYTWPLVVCLVTAAASPRWWVPALRRWGVVDVPNARSSHRHPTIRGAGLAPAAGVLVGLLVALPLFRPADGVRLSWVLATALAFAALGLTEDMRGLAIPVRAGAQLGLGLVLGVGLCTLLDRPLWWALPVGLAVATYVNAANFMDGVDGMSALHGLVSGAYFFLLGLRLDHPWIAVAGALTAAGFAGFAPWNLLRRRVFLGDVGSYLLGALVVGCGSAVFLSGAPLLLAVAPALPYLADTGLTLVCRSWRHERVLESHRGHVYQRLTDRGWSHLASALAVAGSSVVCSLAALWSTAGGWPMVGALLVIALVLTGYLTAPRWAVVGRAGIPA
jgi:UDP-N-acetylmuramyl pentapeptide phosphotransferase/UDP-N-acetylglucosamine-1-phosphate transferase